MPNEIIKLKIAVAVISALPGCFWGIFSPVSIFIITDIFGKNDHSQTPIWIPLSISIYFLIIYTVTYIIGMKYLSLYPYKLFHSENESLPDAFLPYIDFSWLWIIGHSSLFSAGIIDLVRDIIAGNPRLSIHLTVFLILLGYHIALNYFIGPKFCTEEQKKYFLGPFINSQINALFRRLAGGRGKKSVH